jgi:hypothetical protein
MLNRDHSAGPDDMAGKPYEQDQDQPGGQLRLARGLRWSDILAEIERDNELRDAA